MNAEEFIGFARQWNPDITPGMEERFRKLEPLYNDWNSKINVISRKDIGSLYMRHVLHSLAIAEYLRRERPDVYEEFREGRRSHSGKTERISVLDLGTGGGFPGIPLAILFPHTDFTLCDSVGKKIIVAGEVASALGLENVTTVNARAESLGRTFDHVVSRAVTALDNFYPWVAGKYTGSILYLKGGDFAEELCRMMSEGKFCPGSVKTWKISDWIDDVMFDEKYVIDIPAAGKARAVKH